MTIQVFLYPLLHTKKEIYAQHKYHHTHKYHSHRMYASYIVVTEPSDIYIHPEKTRDQARAHDYTIK